MTIRKTHMGAGAALTLFAMTSSALAFSPSAGAGGAQLSLWEMIVSAGWLVMLPLLICSVLVVMLIIINFMTLKRRAIITRAMEKNIAALLEKEDLDGLKRYVGERPQAVARILSKALTFSDRHSDATPENVYAVAEAEGGRLAAVINQRALYLMDLGVLAPMLGLMGTVVGILTSFGRIASDEATTMRTMLLAGGISQALIATAAGLIVGILAMAFYSYFRGRVTFLVSEMENHATPMVQEVMLIRRRFTS